MHYARKFYLTIKTKCITFDFITRVPRNYYLPTFKF